MKPKLLFWLLRFLVYFKRFLWWLGERGYFVLRFLSRPIYRILAYFSYKIGYVFRRTGVFGGRTKWWLKREFLQISVLGLFVVLAIPESRLGPKHDPANVGRGTVAFAVFGTNEDYNTEEVGVDVAAGPEVISVRREGSLAAEPAVDSNIYGTVVNTDLATLVAGGTALSKPTIFPGMVASSGRTGVTEYIVEAGDSLGGIAYQFGVSVATILWENGLTERSILRPGNKLRIPPATGVMHTVKRGDTIKKIAALYGAKTEDIINFNKLDTDGSDLKIGEKLMVPGGAQVVSRVTNTTSSGKKPILTQNYNLVARPNSSTQAPSTRGFVWPSAGHIITQYYNWKHHAIDVAGGGMGTPIYAAKAGTVLISQCGWNYGYGCYVVLDHGGGVKTVYGHNSRLLVSAGEEVEAGQTITLMGNTGNVRGVTGIHLHFEVQVNGVRKNPLDYVRP